MSKRARCYHSLQDAGYAPDHNFNFVRGSIDGKVDGAVATIPNDAIGAGRASRENFHELVGIAYEDALPNRIAVGDKFTVAVVRAHAGTPVLGGGNAGASTVGSVTVPDDAVDENLVLTCTNADTPVDAAWSVVGTESDAHAAAQSGVSYSADGFAFTITQDASTQVGDTITIPVVAQVVGAAVKDVANVGDYTVSTPTADLDTASQTFTFTCANADTEGDEQWSNVGGVDGVQDTMQTGDNYDDLVQLTVTAPSV